MNAGTSTEIRSIEDAMVVNRVKVVTGGAMSHIPSCRGVAHEEETRKEHATARYCRGKRTDSNGDGSVLAEHKPVTNRVTSARVICEA